VHFEENGEDTLGKRFTESFESRGRRVRSSVGLRVMRESFDREERKNGRKKKG
jgi:hypothetical protein